VPRWFKESAKRRKPETLLLILIATLPVSLPALDSFFTFDDLMNISYYVERPVEAILSNLLVFTSLHRPLGSLVYLPLYYLFGMQPFFYYLAGAGIYSFNLILLFVWNFQLTRSRLITLISVTLLALHPTIHNVLYNFGALYELLTLTFILLGLLCYRTYLEGGNRKYWYLLAFFCYLCALNAKETAAAVPMLFLSYEVIYLILWQRKRQRIENMFKRLAPIFAVSLVYTMVKILGKEAYWRDNPLYVYQSDWTFLHNLADYLDFLFNHEVQFGVVSAMAIVCGTLGLAWVLKNRHMLFGLAFALWTLLPVLALPRVWDLFLYIPLAGFSLYAAGLISELLHAIHKVALKQRPYGYRPTRITEALMTILFLTWILGAVYPDIDRARREHYHERSAQWRSFSSQLYSFYSKVPEDTAMAFISPPFDLRTHDRWCLHFLIRLHYGHRSIKIFRIPEESDQFVRSLSTAGQAHLFEWRDGVLIEHKLDPLILGAPIPEGSSEF